MTSLRLIQSLAPGAACVTLSAQCQAMEGLMTEYLEVYIVENLNRIHETCIRATLVNAGMSYVLPQTIELELQYAHAEKVPHIGSEVTVQVSYE